MSDTPEAGRANVWALTWRFLKRARPYRLRILLTILIVFTAAGAKAGQAYLIKPVIDYLDKPATAAPPPAVEAPRKEPSAVFPDFVSRWIDRLRRFHQSLDLETIAILAIALSVAMFVFGYLRDVTTSWLRVHLLADLRNDVVHHLTYTPLRFHLDRRSGDLISRVTNDVGATESVVQFYFDDMLVHAASVLSAFALIFSGSWKLAAGAIVFLPIYILPLTWLGRKLRRARRKSLERMGDMTQTMLQTFAGIKIVKAFNMEEAQDREFRAQSESFVRKLMATVRRKSIGENSYQLFMGLGLAVMLFSGVFLLPRDVLTAGNLSVFAMGLAIMNTSIRELSKSYNRMLEASTGCERVFELLDQPRETEHDRGEELNSIDGGIEFEKVSFAYQTEPVLRTIGFRASPGEVIALVGRSGAGKTTLCDLVCRFYDPTEGRITLGGRDLKTLRRSSLLSRIAVVTQDVFLFNTTIEENIRCGRPGASHAEIEEAARAADIHEFIAGLPQGYATIVGERGAKLSGGQRQRIAIARAVLRNPSILILDEATSALDSESEKQVQDSLARLIRSGGNRRITFVIAHRLSTVREADRILVLDEGRIVEDGKHDQLLSRGGVYAQLHQLQFAKI